MSHHGAALIDLQAVPDMQKPSFKLDVEQSALEYRNSEHQSVWQIPLESIVLMAEYTTNEGPYLDDYFLVFVSADGDSLNIATASFYADGRDEIVRNLAHRWKTNIELLLFNSTEWASRVVWPPTLVGREYFESRVVEPKKLAEKLRRFAFGPVYEYFPSQSVREFLL
jgi:hypothetical protein